MGSRAILKVAAALGLASAVSGCTSVKMVQREDCWVRRTEKWYGAVNEELGPCKRAAPAWVADRHTRLVQECVAQADYRWQTKALEAFSRGEPWPEQAGQEQVLELCMNEAARAYIVENDDLKARLAEVNADRETLKEALARNDEHLRNSHDMLAASLGEAAQRPPGTATATATATSDGKATTENATESGTPVAPAITWVTTQGAPCGAPQTEQAQAARQTAAAETTDGRPTSKPKKVASSTAVKKKDGAAALCAPATPEQKPTEAVEVREATAEERDASAEAPTPSAAAAPVEQTDTVAEVLEATAEKAAPPPAP